MNNIIILCLFIQLTNLFFLDSLKPDKTCAKCIYFLKTHDNLEVDNSYGKCLLFPKVDPLEYHKRKKKELVDLLVTGNYPKKESDDSDYYYCSIARNSENMCGFEGKKFKKR